MASTALMKARETARRGRSRAAAEIAKREHTLFSVTAAAILGVAEAKGHRLPSILGLDGTVVAGTAALLFSDAAGGSAGRMLQSFADGMLAIGAYKMGRAVGGAAIAGAGDSEALEAVLAAG